MAKSDNTQSSSCIPLTSRLSSATSSSKASSSAPRSVVSQSSATFDEPTPVKSPKPTTPKSAPRSPSAEAATKPSTISKNAPKNKKLELSAAQWAAMYGYEIPSNLPLRPRAPTKLGQGTKVAINTSGIEVSNDRTVVPARAPNLPRVQHTHGTATPGTLKGKKLLTMNTAPLKSWAISVVCGRRGREPDKNVVRCFITSFINAYIQRGGRVENKQPPVVLATGGDPAEWATAAWNAAGTQSGTRPQILVFILPDEEPMNYERIKRSCDCRNGGLPTHAICSYLELSG